MWSKIKSYLCCCCNQTGTQQDGGAERSKLLPKGGGDIDEEDTPFRTSESIQRLISSKRLNPVAHRSASTPTANKTPSKLPATKSQKQYQPGPSAYPKAASPGSSSTG